MTKRARYDGPHEEVVVIDSEAGVYAEPLAIVKRGGLLPLETIKGDPMPARIRDEFLHNDNPDWSTVNQSTPSGAKTDDDTKKGS